MEQKGNNEKKNKKRTKIPKWIWWTIGILLILVIISEVSWYFYIVRRSKQIKCQAVKTEQTGKSGGESARSVAEKQNDPVLQLIEEQKKKLEQEEAKKKNEGKVIVIDAGHQAQQNSEKEPLGPGSSEMKAKVSSGTAGIRTKTPEYQVTLDVALKLQKELEKRGYTVVMVRTSNEVNISNAERAQIANEKNAAAFVRLHCDGSENTSASGAMTICMTASNPYCAEVYEKSKALSAAVLNHLSERTGASANKVWETDTMSGINWSKVPVTIVEMGYLTNPTEEQKLISSDYQELLAAGIADGLEEFLKEE